MNTEDVQGRRSGPSAITLALTVTAFAAAGFLTGKPATALAFWVIGGLGWYATHHLGKRRGRPSAFWLGWALGWIGFLIVLAFLPKTREKKVQEAQERLRIERDAAIRL